MTSGAVVIDKPRDWTSHDVVAKLRGIFGQKKIGHTGTLDPMATGVLVVLLGRATRASELLEADEKEYIASLRLGLVTNTQDTTGEVLSENPVEVSRENLEAALRHFTGSLEQLPPMYSAIKVNGKKLYELARKGQEAERKTRSITIYALDLLSFDGKEAVLRVVCSKGTYIRTLCHDIGAFLGCGGCMSALRRSRAGAFSLDRAVTLEQLQAAKEDGSLLSMVHKTDALFSQYPALLLSGEQAEKCRCGVRIPLPENAPDGLLRVYGPGEEFLLLGRGEDGRLITVKSFFEVNQG